MADDLLKTLIPCFGCVIERTPDGVRLTGASRDWVMAAAIVPRMYRPPFTFRVEAQTDSTNLRLHYHIGEIIFNWECSVQELRVHFPDQVRRIGIPDKGFITPGQWHELIWEINRDSMRVLVDGEVRFEGEGKFEGVEAPVAIGPCFGSAVTVRTLSVTVPKG